MKPTSLRLRFRRAEALRTPALVGCRYGFDLSDIPKWSLAGADSGAQSCVVANTRWRDLDPRVRQAIMIGGAFEGGLKVAALIDLVQRPRGDIRGSKKGWAVALAVINSGGVVPIVYMLRGRRT